VRIEQTESFGQYWPECQTKIFQLTSKIGFHKQSQAIEALARKPGEETSEPDTTSGQDRGKNLPATKTNASSPFSKFFRLS
jgi:hypothetical protein